LRSEIEWGRSEIARNTCFILSEICETEAGVADHMQQAESTWKEFPEVVAWMKKCKATGAPAAPIVDSLW
jgi:hypothetical protein